MNKERVRPAAQFMKFICFCLLLCWWVMAAARGRGSAKRSKQRQKANEWMNEAESTKHNELIEENNWTEWEWSEIVWFHSTRAGLARSGLVGRSHQQSLFHSSTNHQQPSIINFIDWIDWFVEWWSWLNEEIVELASTPKGKLNKYYNSKYIDSDIY